MSKKINIGVMQGRLLPKYQGRYQAHPVDNWKPEFKLAKTKSLDCIEFILDYNDIEKNPLMNEEGIKEIKNEVNNSGVKFYRYVQTILWKLLFIKIMNMKSLKVKIF